MIINARRILPALLCACVSVACVLGQGGAQGSPSLDKLVDVGGGRRLHISCSGTNVDRGPTVILEAGFGNASAVWNRVQPEVAKFARVCSYDRAGLGASDPVAAQRTVVSAAEDLHALLAAAKIAGPYVLVGHSLGGILARLYASYYPAEVAGMVLVDSAHEDEPDRAVALIPADALKEMLRQAGPADLTPQSRERIDSCSIRTIMDALNWHGDIPLVVLTQGRPYGPDMVAVPAIAPQAYRLHLEMQRDLVSRSPRGRQVIAEKSGHGIHQDQPELVVNAVREVVKEVEAAEGGRR
jgi:pimeloyl-ACP methyl ester carboxylesterase